MLIKYKIYKTFFSNFTQSYSAIALAIFIVTFTSGEISPKIKKFEYIYDKESNRKIGYVVTRVQPMNTKFPHENVGRNETSSIKFPSAKKIGRVKENERIDRTDANQENKGLPSFNNLTFIQ